MKKYIFTALLLLISLVVARDASANLLVNGGFEVPIQGPPNYATFNIPAGSTYITGWNVVQGNVDLTTNANYGPGINTLDPSSVQAIDLIGDANGSGGVLGGIAQAFATVIGQVYQLVFHYSHNNGTFAPVYGAQVTLADANVPGGTILSYEVSQVFGASPWLTSTVTFTAVSDLTSLSFISTRGGFNAGIYIDNVSVTPVGAGVPESGSTLAMMLLGVLGVGFLAHRWRNSLCA